ncbi:receptor-like protein 7 isoform X2 [Carex rostrata]
MSLFSHPSLKSFDLSYNQLSGYLHELSNRSSILESINLSNNNLEGQLPISLFKFSKLRVLNLESNNFNGTLNLDVIHNTKYLKYLSLSNNKLSIIEGKNHNKPFYASFPQMRCIILASCNLTKIPFFLSYQTNIDILDLSNNKIDGVLPTWDAHLTLQILDIHSNRLSGPIPLLPRGIGFVDFSFNYFISLPAYFVPSLEYLFVSNNRLMGEIPLTICNGTLLRMLDLSYNNLTGTMPPCLLVDAQLEVLDLKGNKLSGPLSRNICQGCKFRTIDLSRNRINGSLPQSLVKCNTLEILDLGNNQIVDRFPSWLGNLENLTVLVLRSNQLYGTISTMEAKTNKNNSLFSTLKVLDLSSNRFQGIIPKILTQNLKAMVTNSDTITFQFEGTAYYQNSITVISKGQEIGIKNSLRILSSLDLSQNEFSGEIPKEIWQLNSLHVLNLSHNALTGQIPSQFGSFEQLESMDISSLDLSSNHLSGPIPEVLGYLPLLSSLNVSYNYLVGQVPPFGHFSTFSNASYLGNPGLCGSPLSTQCVVAPLSRGMNQVLSSKSSTGIIGLSVSIVLGFGAGFVSVIWAMISWENGSKRFNFIIDRFYFRHFTVITDAYM